MGTPFNLKNGSIAISAEVPGGLYNSAHLKKLAAISEQNSVIMKATEDQRIALFVVPEQAESVARELVSVGMTVRDYQGGVHQPVSCVGALCPESKQDALKASLDITEALSAIEASCALKIGINGCSACCVPCHTMDISITGSEEGYRISLGGKQSMIPELAAFAAEGVPPGELVERIRALVDIWKDAAEPGERLAQMIERNGISPFLKALAPYSRDAGGGDAGLMAEENPQTGPEIDVVAEMSDDAAIGAGMDDAVPVDTLLDAPMDVGAPMDPIAIGGEAVPEEVGVSEDLLESTMVASMEAEAAVPVLADENASAREEVLDSLAGSESLETPLADEIAPDGAADSMESVVAEAPVDEAPLEQAHDDFSENSLGNSLDEATDNHHDNVVSLGSPVHALESMEIDSEGKFVFVFAGGAAITVDPGVIPFGGSRSLKFAGKELIVSADAKGFNICVDGLTFHMPLAA